MKTKILSLSWTGELLWNIGGPPQSPKETDRSKGKEHIPDQHEAELLEREHEEMPKLTTHPLNNEYRAREYGLNSKGMGDPAKRNPRSRGTLKVLPIGSEKRSRPIESQNTIEHVSTFSKIGKKFLEGDRPTKEDIGVAFDNLQVNPGFLPREERI
ncbi:hypothetical protein FEM48_Zijuj04G0136500 [Ziziphus jujuba var. spinosa]|uniref:Uncharacterized protein n=1 Tax=Ziziphus jujuba var. spinosa TaxID=714518 RepID=A0A978VK72_ZIZJJ|nr:hypothetical protein FEM48_Zijuj04G0136500 [Ziziphus jujuba var. spinosa]